MAKINQHKVVASLPDPLEANSIYYVRVGAGFDQYVTNGSGTIVAYQSNAKLELDGKVDKEEGKVLSSNDYTTAEKNKLASLENFDDSAIQAELATKVDKVAGKGLSDENYTLAEKNKLGGIEAGAQVNSVTSVAGKTGDVTLVKADVGLGNADNTSDANKPISTATATALNGKVDKVSGKQLSTEDYTTAEKNKLAGVEAGAQVNVATNIGQGSRTSTTIPLTSSTGTGTTLPSATTSLAGLQSAADKAKLDGIATGATKNATDAQLRDRSTHTGTQPISSVTNLQSSLDSKVDKVAGYGLSQENFTPAEKSKLASIEGSKFKGEYVSLAALQAAHPSPEVGSYAYVDAGVGEVVSKYIWDSSDAEWVKQQGETAALTPAEIKTLYEENPDTNAFTDSEKAKLSGIQAGATANATNAQLRDRSTHTGTQAISTVSGLQTALDGKVDGDDARLTNARDWTASVVTQAEAEAGTATTARKWTSQRVRQAIVAWFNGVSGALGRTILTRTTAAQVRSDIGLGTAATFDSGFSGGLVATSAKTAEGVSYSGTSPDPTVKYSFGGATGGWARGIMTANLAEDTQKYGGFWFGLLGNQSNYIRGVIGFGNDSNWWQTAHQISLYENQDPTVGTSNTIFHKGNILKGTGTDDNFPMSQKAVTDALATKANTSTQIIAGNGLSGGGTLADNRTLSVNFGTTSGTVKEGNWQPTTASKTQVLNGTANAFVTGTSYHNVISWATASHSSGTVSLNLDTSLNHDLSVSGNITMGMPANADAGKTGDIVIRMTAEAAVSWATQWKFLGSVPDIGANGDMWVVSYKVLSSTEVLASAAKVV